MDVNKRIHLEKILCYILRHHPEEYNVELDDEGYADIKSILSGMNISKEELLEIVALSSKGRFELIEEKVRALYGHSVKTKILKSEVVPPLQLFHGTSNRAKESILKEGLKPMKRQYVHLSTDIETAIEVAKRHSDNPVILVVDANRAYLDGIKFYEGNKNTILVHEMPVEYIHE